MTNPLQLSQTYKKISFPAQIMRLLSLLLYVISHFMSILLHSAATIQTDHLALLAFKDEVTFDPLQLMRSWNDSVHFCRWQGVTSALTAAWRVSVTKHRNLSFLEALDLDGNSFQGPIPTNISDCARLAFLSLHENNLSGDIPAELSKLQNLETIQLDRNFLSGNIPPSLGNISSLRTLSLPFNKLEGNIPDAIGQLTNLSYFAVCRNKLSGTIPSLIYKLSSLTLLSAPGNRIHGTLPPDLGLNLPKLELLNLHTNNLTGTIPVTLSDASNLKHIIMGTNQFTGKVPSLASLHSLVALALHHNNLGNGEDDDSLFLSSLTNCPNLEVLTLNDNKFRAVLRTLQLGRNQFHGTIPDGIGNLVSLEALGMEMNQLSGIIPVSLGNLQKLSEIFLNDNNLSGTIPSSLGSLSLLGWLNFTNNSLEGTVPPSLGQCRNLLMMSISQNNPSGIIPKLATTLSYVDLSHNRLTGSLPGEVGKLTRLTHLDVSNNELSGDIPSNLGSCRSLVSLYMADNFFQGEIPQKLLPVTSHISSANQSSSLALKGSIGYVAPEYGMGSKVTTHGDVYSYGIT